LQEASLIGKALKEVGLRDKDLRRKEPHWGKTQGGSLGVCERTLGVKAPRITSLLEEALGDTQLLGVALVGAS
jgi:hypothetical protein